MGENKIKATSIAILGLLVAFSASLSARALWIVKTSGVGSDVVGARVRSGQEFRK